MKKTALMAIILILFAFASLEAQTTDANQEYIKAMTAPDNAQKVKLLKEYIKKYSGKGTQYENFAYANICLLSTTADEITEYGEKALTMGGLDDLTQCNILLRISAIYSQRSQNLIKAKNYSLQVVQIAKTNKNEEASATAPAQWDKFIGAGYFTHGQALEKARDTKGALDSYINSYKILKDPQIANSLKKIGKSLYDFKFYRDAERAFQICATALKDYVSIYLYAKTLHRNKKKEEALKFYKQAYTKQKTGDVSYNIGIILASKAEKNPSVSPEAIRYLLDASFLSPPNSKKAMQLAEHIFFNFNKDLRYNETVKEIQKRYKELEELTNNFNKKFGDKEEDDLSAREKRLMEILRKDIESEQEAIKKLEAEQKKALDKFKKLIEEAKQRLGIK